MGHLPLCGGENSRSGCVGVGTVVDDAFQTLNNLDQSRHVGDFIQWRGLQLCQQGTDLLLRDAIEDDLHAAQATRGRLQHVENFLLQLDVAYQVRLVGMAVFA